MRSLRSIVAAVAIAASATTMSASIALAAGAWTVQTPPATVTNTTDFRGVYFRDLTHGWAVGSDEPSKVAVAVYTTDGGATWQKATVSPTGNNSDPAFDYQLSSVVFVSATKGFAVGNRGSIYLSIDGGLNWNRLTTGLPGTTPNLFDVRFGDATHGCAVGAAGTIWCTADGGTNWKDDGQDSSRDYEGISYGSASVAYIAGGLDGIFKATNANAADPATITWVPQTNPTVPQGATLGSWADVDCADATHCSAVLDGSTGATGEFGVMAATTDGSTWTWQGGCGAPGLERIAMVPGDALHGWVVGGTTAGEGANTGYVCATVNGTSWAHQTTPSGEEFQAVYAVDRCHAWAVTESDGIQAYADPTACLPPPPPSPSPSASIAAVVNLPKAGAPANTGPGRLVAVLALILAAGGIVSLRRTSRR